MSDDRTVWADYHEEVVDRLEKRIDKLEAEAAEREKRFETALDHIYDLSDRKLIEAHERGFDQGFASREPDTDGYLRAHGAGQEDALGFAADLAREILAQMELRKTPPFPATADDRTGQKGLLRHLIHLIGG